jgi:hypothetical protein
MFGKRGKVLLFIGVWIGGVLATADLELPKVEHVAYQLKKGGCRKLVAAFNDPLINVTHNSDAEERMMAFGISCLRQLQRCNSQLGEQKDESYSRITQGLKVLGYDNLAEWLTRNVIHYGVDNFKIDLFVNSSGEVTQANETLKRTPKSATPKDVHKWKKEDIILLIFLAIFLPLLLCSMTNCCGCCKKTEVTTEITGKEAFAVKTNAV